MITAPGADKKVIDKERFVYLTADSQNVLKELDPNDVYIIGGIVDRNRYINLTLDKANKEGIRHGKLPIGDYMKL
jgi:tRNA (guanine9-N1)-methyltransferase